MKLPKEFTDISLATLWEFCEISKELTELAETAEERKYWVGWYDCMAHLFSDLTNRHTTKLDPLWEKFENFRMEDRLLKLEREQQEERGY